MKLSGLNVKKLISFINFLFLFYDVREAEDPQGNQRIILRAVHNPRNDVHWFIPCHNQQEFTVGLEFISKLRYYRKSSNRMVSTHVDLLKGPLYQSFHGICNIL